MKRPSLFEGMPLYDPRSMSWVTWGNDGANPDVFFLPGERMLSGGKPLHHPHPHQWAVGDRGLFLRRGPGQLPIGWVLGIVRYLGPDPKFGSIDGDDDDDIELSIERIAGRRSTGTSRRRSTV